MAVFQYRALQAEGGSLTEGRLEAGGRAEAFRVLEGRGLKPVSLKEAAAGETVKNGKSEPKSAGFGFKLGGNKVSFKSLEAFIRQLSGLLAAGVPLSRALKLLSREAATPFAKERWKAVHDLVIDGTSLHDAMARFPDTFPRVHVAMVQAGELGGFLDVVLNQIAE